MDSVINLLAPIDVSGSTPTRGYTPIPELGTVSHETGGGVLGIYGITVICL